MKWLAPATVIAVFLMINGAIISRIERLDPMQPGTADDFLSSLWGVTVGSPTHVGACNFWMPPGENEVCVYATQGFHQMFFRSVPRWEVEALLPEAMRVLRTSAMPPEEEWLVSVRAQAALAWCAMHPESPLDLEELVAASLEAERRWWRTNHPDLLDFLDERGRYFETDLWPRMERYWVTVLFEFVFLNVFLACALILVPQIKRPWFRSALAGMVPVLFFLPHWSGYAPLAFTSAGPIGGVLYPALLMPFARFPGLHLPWDDMIHRWIPPICEPFNQSGGGAMVLSGRGGVTFSSAAFLGAILALLVLAWNRRQRISRWLREGETARTTPKSGAQP